MGQAIELANSFSKFPQMCLQADRNSAYYATYSATSLEDALRYENENGKQVLELVHFTYFQLNLSTVECRSTALNIFVSPFFQFNKGIHSWGKEIRGRRGTSWAIPEPGRQV